MARIGYKALMAVGLALCAVACGGSPDHPKGWGGSYEQTDPDPSTTPDDNTTDPTDTGDDVGNDQGDDTPAAECDDGEERTCKVKLPTQGEQENCFVGKETCIDGQWSPCQ